MEWPAGYQRRLLGEVSSTLDVARQIFSEIDEPEWILAQNQTSPRGRNGRKWISGERNFSATLLMRLDESPQAAALRSFVMSLALFDALVAIVGPAHGLSLKWPNDVLLNCGKLAGILLESCRGRNKSIELAIGIGVNLLDAPVGRAIENRAANPVSLFGETGVSIEAVRFMDYLAASYARRERQFRDLGFESIRVDWLKHAARLGDIIEAVTRVSRLVGVFETVDRDGNLVLNTADGLKKIAAADVFFEGVH